MEFGFGFVAGAGAVGILLWIYLKKSDAMVAGRAIMAKAKGDLGIAMNHIRKLV